MAIEALVARYGLLAIFAGAGIEGEAVVLTGGILASKGLLPLWGVAVASAAGSCLVDQIWFRLGRHFRDNRRVKAAQARPAFARAIRLLERYPTAFILSFRFIYGLRTVSPVAIGTTGIPSRRFVPLNILSAAIWGPAIAWLGYAFGMAAAPYLQDMKSVLWLAFGIVALGAIVILVLRIISGRKSVRQP